MLDIVARYHCMQFQGKLINQSWGNGKKPSFGTDFGPFGPNLGSKTFFHEFYLYYMLDIVASYHCMEFQGKLMNQTWENSKKTNFGPDLGPFDPNLKHQFLFSKTWLRLSIDIMISYHGVQYQKKLMIQSWVNLVTDGWTDRQTDVSDFIGRCPTNVERPTFLYKERNFLLKRKNG